jgi:hypothetical protein
MKKIFLIVFFFVTLFANSVGVYDLKYDKTYNGFGGLYINNKDRVIFLTYTYDKNTKALTSELLNSAKNSLKNMFCRSRYVEYLKRGYIFVVTYVYKNKKVVQVVINNCR